MSILISRAKIKLIGIVLVFIAIWSVERNEAFGESEDYSDCWFFKNKDREVHAPSQAAIDFVEYVSKAAGLPINFKVVGIDYKGRSTIATAFMCGDQRMIGYDVNNFFWFDGNKTDFYSAGVLLHEMGHHYRGHLFTGELDEAGEKREELEADYFAGFIIESIGGTLKQALQKTREYDESYSKTHPPKSKRVEAVSNGWRDAKMKTRLTQPRCNKSEWIGEEFEIEFQVCRQLKDCRSGQPIYRVACEADIGEWTTK